MSLFHANLADAGYGRLSVLGEIGVAVDAGQLLVILGSNGAGKSTALRAIIGTVRCGRRQLVLDGRDISRLPAWKLPSHGVVLVPDGARCFPSLTVQENLSGAYVAARRGNGAERFATLSAEIFDLFPVLREKRDLAAGTLSGGQRQMLAVARALMSEPRVLILDEPSAGLAPKIVEELFEALGRIKQERGCGIVMAEQNVGYAARVADHCLVLEEGQVVVAGPMQDVVSNERLRTAYLGL